MDHHHLYYYIILHGMEKVQDIYRDKVMEKEFRVLQDYINHFSGKYEGIVVRGNGFHVNQAIITTNGCDVEDDFYQDYQDFNKAYQQVMDEQYLIPTHVRLIYNIYGQKAFNNFRITQYTGQPTNSGYPCLFWCFMNLPDLERVFIHSTYQSVKKELIDYAKLSEIDELGIEAKLDHQINFLKTKVQARQLRHAIMCWEGKCTLPTTPKGYLELFNQYKENLYWLIMYEKEKAVESDKARRQAYSKTTYKPSYNEEAEMGHLSQERKEELKQLSVLASINQDVKRNTTALFLKSEISVIERQFDMLLIKEGIKLISKHDEALKGALEMGVADNQINAFIYPYQQFASTLFETVDKNPHLDIVTKASFVQQFLTRLTNRCTKVATLTSGPGVVFSLKDFNECVQTLCRGMIKYCETSIRSVNETHTLKAQQLQHLVYVNERQMQYYKNKCENFVKEIDKIINAKMTEKGSSIIYELDITHRELRMLKDNYYLMERMMREEIHKQFVNEITEKDYLINKYRQSFAEFKNTLSAQKNSEVYDQIVTLENRVRARANVYKMTDIKSQEDKLRRLLEAENQKGIPLSKPVESEVKLPIDGTEMDLKSIDRVSEAMDDGTSQKSSASNYGAYEPYIPSAKEEVSQLLKALRKQKNMHRMKEVLMKERHEREMNNLKQQLTSNQCLWEQLAESQKREQIMKQELYFTQQSLATSK